MRGTEHLHPELQEIAQKFLEKCNAAGLNVLITETWRSEAEQNALYAQGRTAPGNIVTNCKYPQSPHCWGVAFDFCRNVKGREYDDGDGFFGKVGAIGKTLGLAWGGDWKGFVDKPHLELAKYLPNNSVMTIQKQYGTPEKFKAVWPQTMKLQYQGKEYVIPSVLKEGLNYPNLRSLAGVLKLAVGYDEKTEMVTLK